MNKLFLSALLLLSGSITFAQKETFGVVNYTVPANYELVKNENVLTYYKEDKSTGAYCNFFIYKIMPGQGGTKNDFDFAWDKLMQAPFKFTATPAMQPEATLKGWKFLIGNARYIDNGVATLAMLINFSGENNMQAVCILSNSDKYKIDIENFIASVDVMKETIPSPATQPQSEKGKNEKTVSSENNVTGAGNLNIYSITAPPTWNLNSNENNLTLEKNTALGKRVIEFMKPISSSGDLEKDMEHIFFEVFAGWELHLNPNATIFEAGSHEKGQTGQGLNYYMLSNGIKKKGPNNSDVIKATVLLIQAGNKVAIINTTDNILGSEADMALNFMLFNLKLNGVEGKAISNRQPLVGTWGSNSGLYGNSLSFVTSYMADGKYYVLAQSSYTIGYDYYNDIIKKKQFKSQGSYNINSNVLERTPSSGSLSKYYIRFLSRKYGNREWENAISIYDKNYDKSKINSPSVFQKIN
ncbi:MAG: hypothetical protein JST23_00345 [Bacteroidetes bacterium]|nr:hypothetical protein [Bacteroidota bacterium]